MKKALILFTILFAFFCSQNIQAQCNSYPCYVSGGCGATLTLYMYDSFGDGWNDYIFGIYGGCPGGQGYSDTNFYYTTTLYNGYSGVQSFWVPCGSWYIQVIGGWYGWEVSWQLYGSNGNLLDSDVEASYYSAGPAFSIGDCYTGCIDSNADNYNSGAYIQWSANDCTYSNGGGGSNETYGCTDSNATNYNSDANIDDGSCTYENISDCTEPTECYFELLTPNGGEAWYIGSTYDITWNSISNYNTAITLYKGDTELGEIIGDVDDANTFSWTIPSELGGQPLVSGNDYKVKVYDSGLIDPEPFDFSDNFFSININDINTYWEDVPSTDCSSAILISENVSFCGVEINVGDLIGVFYTNSNGYLSCGGYVEWQGETTVITAWGNSNVSDVGFESGEEFIWYVFDVESNTAIPVTTTMSFGSNTYSCNGLSGISSINLNSTNGCTDSNAINYDSCATENDGSCIILGCTDSSSPNYNTSATNDDGSCVDYIPYDIDTYWEDVPSTDCNMTLLITQDVSVNGGDLTVGDLIGVFYTDYNGNLSCGGYIEWQDETTSIAAWGYENGNGAGFENGEEFIWYVFDVESNTAIPVTTTMSFGSDTYSCNGLSGISSIDFTSIYSQEIPLESGWNIWSTYIAPEDSNIESVLSGVGSNLIIVKDENGQVYWPIFGLNNIGNLTEGKGYQLKMIADDDLIIEGNLVPFNLPISLTSGWGIIGYVKPEPSNAEEMMSPVVNDLIIMKDENGQVYWPIFGLNNIGNMQAGEGYQVKMTQDAILTYSSNSGRFGYTENLKTIHFDDPLNTGNNMTIGLPTSSWAVMPAIGDEIAAYDQSGRLIGTTLFTGKNIALTVWGDDLSTTSKDGLSIGEKIAFKLWNADTNSESNLIVTKWDVGNDEYAIDGISIASDIVIGSKILEKKLMHVFDILGGTTTQNNKNFQLYVYDDGSVEKKYLIK